MVIGGNVLVAVGAGVLVAVGVLVGMDVFVGGAPGVVVEVGAVPGDAAIWIDPLRVLPATGHPLVAPNEAAGSVAKPTTAE